MMHPLRFFDYKCPYLLNWTHPMLTFDILYFGPITPTFQSYAFFTLD